MPNYDQNNENCSPSDDLEQHKADIESIKKLDKKLADQLDKVYKRIASELETNPEDIDAHSRFSQIKMLRTRLAGVGKKLEEYLPKKEKAAVLRDVANIATELRGSLYKFDIAEDTISSFGKTAEKNIDDRIREALEKNPEKIQKKKLEEAENLLISAVDTQTALKETYSAVSGPEICRRYYLDIMNRALDRNISYVLAVLSGKKDALHFEEVLKKTDTFSLNNKELRDLERILGVDPQSLDGAMKLLQMRVDEANGLLGNVENIVSFDNVAQGFANLVDFATLTGVVDSAKVDKLWEEADVAFKESSTLLLAPAPDVFKDELAVFDRFSLHGLDQKNDLKALKELALGLKAAKSPEFGLYLSVVHEIGEEKSNEELIASYKKLNAKISGTPDSLIEKYGPVIGWKFYEILETIKQELINREVMRQIESGEFKLDGLLDLAKKRSGFVKVYEATDDFGYVGRTREGLNENGDVSSSSETEDINTILEKSDAYLILVKEGKGLRVYFTQKFYVDNGKLQTKEGKESLSETPDALEALQEIGSAVASFNTSKKIIVEKYLLENVETNSLIKDFYRGNLSLAAGDIKRAKKAYLSFLNGYKKTRDGATKDGISENQLLEAKIHLKNIAKLELIQIFKGIDEIINSVEYDIYRKSLSVTIAAPFTGMSRPEGRKLVEYLTAQKNALSLASDLLKSDDDVVTVEQALTVPDAPGELKDFDLLSDLKWADDSLYQRKLGRKLGQKNLYHAAQYFYEQSFGGLIGKFANQEYEQGKFVFENYYAEHSGDSETNKKASDRAIEMRDQELKEIEGKMSLLGGEMAEFIKLGERKAELESADYLKKLEEQVLSGLIVEDYKKALFGEVTKWAKKNRGNDAQAYTWLNEFEGHYVDTDSAWYEFWGGTDKERLEFVAGLAFDIPMVVASGGVAGVVGKKVAMIAARKLAVDELAGLTLRQVARRAGTSALARTMAARGTGFLAECETFNAITLFGSSASAGRLDQFINPMQHLKGLGHTLVTLGTLKVTGAALGRVSGMKSFAGQYALTPIVDTAALTTTQYVLEGGDIDVRKAIRSNLVLSFGIRVGHGLAGLNSTPVSRSGRAAREARNQVIESELRDNMPHAAERDGIVTRWENTRKASSQADYVADYILDSGVVDSQGNPTSKGVFEGMTLSEAHGLAKFARERGLDVDFLAERCKTKEERVELQKKVLELERSGLEGANAGKRYLEMYRSEGLDRAVFDAFVASPEAKMSEVYKVHKFLSNAPEAGRRLVEGMSNADGYDLLELVVSTKTPPEYIESVCKSAVERTAFVGKYHELDASVARDKKGRVSMDAGEYFAVMAGPDGAAMAVLTSRTGLSLTVEEGAGKAAVRRAKKVTEYCAEDPLVARATIEGMSAVEVAEFLDFSFEYNQTSFDWITKGLNASEKMGVVRRVVELAQKVDSKKPLSGEEVMAEYRSGPNGRLVLEMLGSKTDYKCDVTLENIYEILSSPESFELGRQLLLRSLQQHPENAKKIAEKLKAAAEKTGHELEELQRMVSQGQRENLNEVLSKCCSADTQLLLALVSIYPDIPLATRCELGAFEAVGGAVDIITWAIKGIVYTRTYGNAIIYPASAVHWYVLRKNFFKLVGEATDDLAPRTAALVAALSDADAQARVNTLNTGLPAPLQVPAESIPMVRKFYQVDKGMSRLGEFLTCLRGITPLRLKTGNVPELKEKIDELTKFVSDNYDPLSVLRTQVSVRLAILSNPASSRAAQNKAYKELFTGESALFPRYEVALVKFESEINKMIRLAKDLHGALAIPFGLVFYPVSAMTVHPTMLARYSDIGTGRKHPAENPVAEFGYRAAPFVKIFYLLYMIGEISNAVNYVAGGFSSDDGDDKPSKGDEVAAEAAGAEAEETAGQEAKHAKEDERGAQPNVPMDGSSKKDGIPKSLRVKAEGHIKKAEQLIQDLSARNMTAEADELRDSIYEINVLRGKTNQDPSRPAIDVSGDMAAKLQLAIDKLKALINDYRIKLDQGKARILGEVEVLETRAEKAPEAPEAAKPIDPVEKAAEVKKAQIREALKKARGQ